MKRGRGREGGSKGRENLMGEEIMIREPILHLQVVVLKQQLEMRGKRHTPYDNVPAKISTVSKGVEGRWSSHHKQVYACVLVMDSSCM